ncbi:MAG: hypothetical protein GXY66_04080 [Bacteroidales bacterium]|nr:hypothetical protein [Bacteroidales bacterium]
MRKTLLFIFCAIFTLGLFYADKTWDFKVWSQATLDQLAADAAGPGNWAVASDTRYENNVDFEAGILMANGQEIAETRGLTFGTLNSGKVRIDHGTEPPRLMLNGSNLSFDVLGCKAGNVITVTTLTANTEQERGITATNATRTSSPDVSLEVLVNVFNVVADGTVTFTTNGGGVHIRDVAVVGEMMALNTNTITARIIETAYYDLSGRMAGRDFENLKQGAYIQKTTYDNGAILVKKFLKPTN